MTKKTIVLDYPPISAQPAYQEAYDKLVRFIGQKASVQQKLDEVLQARALRLAAVQVNTAESAIEKAERLLNGEKQDTEAEQIAELQNQIGVLDKAIAAQQDVVAAVNRRLSKQAGERFAEKHKEIVRRMIAAVQELHDANKEEENLRMDLLLLGYNYTTVPAMTYHNAEDPSDSNGNVAYYWTREARDYIQTEAEKAEVVAQTLNSVRKRRVAALAG